MKENVYNANIPWMPTCWVGGLMVVFREPSSFMSWIDMGSEQLENLGKNCGARQATIKANAAILRAMRK